MSALSINEVTTYRWSFDDDVLRYRDSGIPAIGVWRQKLADYGEDKGVELIARSGLVVSNLLWAGGFTGCDGCSHEENVEDARHALHLAAALKTSNLVVYSGSRNGHTLPHARRLFKLALAALLPLAESLGVSLAIEPMHPGCAKEWTFVTSLDEGLKLITEFNSPGLKLVYDTYHQGFDPDAAQWAARVAPHVGVVHLGDGRSLPDREQNRCPLGEGIVPLRSILQAFKSAGYDGPFDVELFGEEIERCNYLELINRSKATFAEMMASAESAVAAS